MSPLRSLSVQPLHWQFFGAFGGRREIYMVVDEDGNVTFTDTPPNDADAVVGPHSIPGTTISSAVSTAPISADKTDLYDALAAYLTRIAFLSSESTIPMGPGGFVVGAEISPSLDSGEQLILLLDGETAGARRPFPAATDQRFVGPPIAGCASRDGARRANPGAPFMSCAPGR